MEAIRTSETLVYFYETTRRHVPEDHHHACRRENVKHQYFIKIHINVRPIFQLPITIWVVTNIVEERITNYVTPELEGSSPHSQEPATGPS
jgi:hypothetical protein